jgi:hypothetical protein
VCLAGGFQASARLVEVLAVVTRFNAGVGAKQMNYFNQQKLLVLEHNKLVASGKRARRTHKMRQLIRYHKQTKG